MAHHKITLVLLTLLLLTAVACTDQPTATATIAPPPTVTIAQTTTAPGETAAAPSPTTAVETPAPTTDAATADAATTAAPTPTLAQTATAEAEATDAPQTFVVDEPVAGAAWSSGDTVTLSGRAPAGAISASLRAAGLVLDSAEATVSSAGDWQMTLDIPSTVNGAAIVDFTVDGEPAAQIPVQIALAGATSGPAITLDHPQPDSTVVSGQVLFFTGTVQRPTDETVTIAVLFEECQTVASTTSFNVGEGGPWWGYIIVPETVFGPACAVAYLGEFDSSGWLAAHAPLDILEADDDQARGVFIGNFAGAELTPGESTTVYGSAYNAPDRQVRVSLQVDGATVAQGTTSADAFGYWEINLVLPADVAATSGEFHAAVSYDGEEVDETVPFDIAP